MRAFVEIDLDTIRSNYQIIRREVGSQIGIIAVVKTDAYGQGMKKISQVLDEAGVEMFAVISLEEAFSVRQVSGKPILIMGYLDSKEVFTAIQNGFIISVYEREMMPVIEKEAVKCDQTARVHLKIETGMNRLGISLDTAIDLFLEKHHFPRVKIEAIYSHLAKANDLTADQEQIKVLRQLILALQGKSELLPIHLVSSGALGLFKEGYFDAVRVGLAFYGVNPVLNGMKPSIRVKAVIMQTKPLKKGEGVSYDYLFTAPKEMQIAIASIGYGDGLSQAYSSKMNVLIAGHKRPVIGKVCMNHIVIDATDLPVKRSDEVVIVGRQRNVQGVENEITVGELARNSVIGHHEIITRLGLNLPRVYIER